MAEAVSMAGEKSQFDSDSQQDPADSQDDSGSEETASTNGSDFSDFEGIAT